MHFRFINSGLNNAFINMAVDEALMLLSNRPVVRFYGWKPSAISLGYSQNIEKINIEKCEKLGIDIVRRITGGKAVFHDKELTYSFICSENDNLLPKSIRDSYYVISKGILMALEKLGIKANIKKENIEKKETEVCLNNISWYEIIVNNKKIAGAAQKRKNGKILQHGPVLIDIDFEKMCSLFKTENMKKLIHESKNRITTLNKELNKNITFETLAEALKSGFEKNFNVDLIEDNLTEREKELAQKLMNEKYKTNEWNFKFFRQSKSYLDNKSKYLNLEQEMKRWDILSDKALINFEKSAI